jgi:Signal transduction histidine kinase
VILIGTTGGLLSCSTDFSRPEEIRFFHNVCDERYSSLSNNDILDITQTKGGKLLVTTLSGGINILDDGSSLSERLNFKHYNATNDRLPDLSLSSIEDQEGNIWIVSENKISKFDAGLNLLEEYKDQIQMAETRPVLLSSGKLLLGSLYGALCIIPDELHKSDFVPPIVFSHLDIYQNNTSRRQDIYSNDEAQYLQPDERNFTITFAALDYVNSPAIKYVYRIKGLNDQWIELGNNRSASLVNVPAGDYLFQVKSTNADGVWVDNVASLSVHIDPVFGETVWAVLLYITMAVVIMLVVICIVLRITNLQRRIDFEQQISNLKLRFFTDISHELRTPLTLIASPIDEVISNEKLSDAGMENMQVAKRNTDRMLRLINQILDFRKIQNDKMKVLMEQVDIIPLILKIYGNFVPMAHTHRIDFRLFCPLDSFVMYTDVDKLEKILFNLLSNAFKYTPDEKSISLSVTCEKQILCLQVKDEGRGINAQKLNRLFTRFDTLDEIDPNMSTGIGLSLVKELLNLLHGTVRVDSKLGEGSSFFIRLPGNRDVFDADANIEFILADSKNSGQEVAIPDKLTEEEEDKETRILIIEDNEELRHFICGVLAREYVVLEAGNGCQGLEMTLRELPDIVISDIMMPEMDGIEYLKRVKGNNDICHIPIILLSAKSSLNDQIQGLEYGADEYITKPFSSAYLKARVDSLLKQRQILYDYYISKMREGEKDTSLMEQLTPSTPQVTHFDNDFIRNILQSVEENIQNSEFKIDDLAEAMSMSRTVFYRKVKSLMGVSPVDFVKTMRIKRAVQLLEQDEFTVSEVGYMSGFTTPQYFSRVFKEAMGCTPKEYRLKHKTIVEQNV